MLPVAGWRGANEQRIGGLNELVGWSGGGLEGGEPVGKGGWGGGLDGFLASGGRLVGEVL